MLALSALRALVLNDCACTCQGSSWSEPNCLGAVCAANMRLEVACRSNDDFFAHMHKHHATSRILFVLDGKLAILFHLDVCLYILRV